MPYRDDFSAQHEQLDQLRRELEETKEQLADLQVRYGRAMAALKVVAEGKRIEKILEEHRKSTVPPPKMPPPKP